MDEIKETFTKQDGSRKVVIFQRSNATFGFEELKFGREEGAWYPIGNYSIAIVDTLDNAIKEANSRVAWLAVES